MTGMGGGSLGYHSSAVAHRFYGAVLVELLFLLLVALLVGALILLRRRGAGLPTTGRAAEPPARRVLRIGFGVLWLVDGLLQLQPDMPLGMPLGIVGPAGEGAPGWVQAIIDPLNGAWLRHPVVGASAVVWIEVGLGLWLLCADRGRWSRLAGAASCAWAAVVWVAGNAMGGLFIGGVSWMFGAPGAAAFYAAAGALLALPPERLGARRLLVGTARAFGALLVALAVLQAWPGRGFWAGGTAKDPGAIPSMAASMADLHQPSGLAALQRHLASASLGGGSAAINLLVVLALLAVAVGLLRASSASVRLAAWAYAGVALVDWIVFQDLGVFGGLATDVNSMLPSALLPLACAAGLVALDAEAARSAVVPSIGHEDVVSLPAAPERRWGTAVATAGTALGALLLGVLVVLPGASADAASAAGAGVASIHLSAPEVALVDQHGAPFRLSDLQGHRVILTFLDPACSSDCPIEAQQMRAAAEQLGASSGVEFVAVNTNVRAASPQDLTAFDDQEGLTGWSSWHFLTGTPAQLKAVWDQWGVQVEVGTNGAMVAHSEPFFAIDSDGVVRSTWVAVTGGGAGSPIGRSGTALIVQQAQRLR
jgi:cytochrome oxidase Cu insertion factor (SCO1/SenC/PrrC family)